jgi:hypothetical protein
MSPRSPEDQERGPTSLKLGIPFHRVVDRFKEVNSSGLRLRLKIANELVAH